ncbi:MAG TPA: ABC transporter permease [Deltaproteobacteria bacterium]|nr:ABC transporter permease [Deltaproteobacteria bacterium]
MAKSLAVPEKPKTKPLIPRIFDTFIRKPEFSAFVSLLLMIIIFSLSSSKFLTPASITSMLTLAAELGTVAVGISFLMISGEFDLSVGSVFGMGAFLLATFVSKGISPVWAFIIVLISCAAMGLINGLITVKFKIPSFITTLGTMMLWRGVLLFITGGFPIIYKGDRLLLDILGGRLVLMLRMTTVWWLIITAAFTILLTRTVYGNWTYATGGNAQAARAVGVPVDKVRIVNFILCATLAGVAGMANMARFNIAQPTLGEGKELEAIAAAVVGGNLLTGGYGSILGTFLGAITISIIRTGLVMMGVPPYLYLGITGVVVIVAVVVSTAIRKKTLE